MNGAQLRALLMLRWQLTRNQWRRGGEINAVITLIFYVAALGLAAVGGVAGVVLGFLVFAKMSPEANMAVWDVLVLTFLLAWAMGVLAELQRSELLDVSRLLHLPVSLRDVFLLNYLASHLSLSLALLLPLMLGLTVGLACGRGPAMGLLAPLVLGFFFMITAWTYCLRGWLAALMVNKRRRRTIIVGIMIVFMLLAQLPNLLMNLRLGRMANHPPANAAEIQAWITRRAEEQRQTLVAFDWVNRCLPLLWLPLGAKTLAEGRPWPALLGACGMIVLGAWGLARAYRGTLRFYQGGETQRPVAAPVAAPTPASKVDSGNTILVEWRLPAIPEEAAATALASFRSMSRAPEVKMALTTTVIMLMAVGSSMFLVRRAPGLRPDGGMSTVMQSLLPGGVVAMTFFGLAQLAFNYFGFDRNGFRAIVLLPAPRRYILLGKNLALLPVALAVFAVYLGLATALAGLGVSAVLTACLDFAAALLAMSVIGNFASILAPYRIAAGSLKPTKMKGLTMLLILASQLFFPLALLPVFVPAGLGILCDEMGWLPGTVVMPVCGVLLVGVSALFYGYTLEPLGRLLQCREQKILQTVTQEVE